MTREERNLKARQRTFDKYIEKMFEDVDCSKKITVSTFDLTNAQIKKLLSNKGKKYYAHRSDRDYSNIVIENLDWSDCID